MVLIGSLETRLPDWSGLPPPRAALAVSVIVPIRDEALRIEAALLALASQRELDGAPFDGSRYEIIVLANNCSDDGAGIARRFAARHPHLALHVVEVRFPGDVAHVGHARACLMDEACRRLRRTVGGTGVIASTDGDTCAAPDWLAATLAAIAAGADAVGGRIVTAAQTSHPPGLRRLVRCDDIYQHLRARLEHALDPDAADPWPRHHQHFGASLAVRVEAYERVGGCPADPWLEDEALYRALRRHDLNVRHSPEVSVVTSGRLHGRVEEGLSRQLQKWAAMAAANAEPHVADPRPWAALLELRRNLRRLWHSRSARPAPGPLPARGGTPQMQRLADFVAHLDLPAAWSSTTWEQSATFGMVWAELERSVRDSASSTGAACIPMRSAIATLRSLIVRHGPGLNVRAEVVSRKDRAGTFLAAAR